MTEPTNIYQFKAKSINLEEIPLTQYRNMVLLIVNTASECGFTSQYQGLQKLYDTYKDRGFAVLGFPCNQFGSQEPGDEKTIRNFCETRFHITFPLFAKVEVNGEQTHPLYQFLKEERPGILGSEAIKWNFTKFLIDKNGIPVKRFAPNTEPQELKKEIEKLL